MTAPHIVDPTGLLGEALSEASPDLMRSLLQTVINALLSADADAVVGAEWGRPAPERVTQRNGYRHRDLDTRVGTIDVAVPKLRAGTYFPDWLLERRKRAEGGFNRSLQHRALRASVAARRRPPRESSSPGPSWACCSACTRLLRGPRPTISTGPCPWGSTAAAPRSCSRSSAAATASGGQRRTPSGVSDGLCKPYREER